jgi:tetratricopeptide (TPR) repeat protein
VEVGAFVDARNTLTRIVELAPDTLRAHLILGELAAWSGDAAFGRAHVERALALDPQSVVALRTRASISLLEGDVASAADDLASARALSSEDSATLVWSGELLRLSGDLDAAVLELQRGIERSRGYPLGAHVALATAMLRRAEGDELDADVHRELLVILRPLLAGLPSSEEKCIADRLEQVLFALRGNRGSNPTWVGADGLTALDVTEHVRFRARALQELLRTRPASWVVARLEELARERPEEPTVLCHLGEVELWLGNYDVAEACFTSALGISPDTRWAYIGMAAAELGRERFQSAIDWCARGEARVVPGRTQYVYRGEAHRRLGRIELAEKDLLRAIELNPERLSAWLNLALLRREPELVRKTATMLQRSAQALFRSACDELDVHPESVLPEPDVAGRLFEHVLTMMRGNRSSGFVTYFTANEQMRFAPPFQTTNEIDAGYD